MTISSTNIAASKSAAFRGSGKKLPPTLILAGGLGTRLRSAYLAGRRGSCKRSPVSGLSARLAKIRGRGGRDFVCRLHEIAHSKIYRQRPQVGNEG